MALVEGATGGEAVSLLCAGRLQRGLQIGLDEVRPPMTVHLRGNVVGRRRVIFFRRAQPRNDLLRTFFGGSTHWNNLMWPYQTELFEIKLRQIRDIILVI